MTKQSLANVIGLATIDKAFRSRLFKDPKSATSGSNQIELDDREIAFLKEKGTKAMIRDYSEYLGIKYSGGGKHR
jgi:hypothetical protein